MTLFKTAASAFAFIVVAAASGAYAQPANHNGGMREACASDIATVCAGVAPGQATMQCVQQNRDKLSDGCKEAMAAMRARGTGQRAGGMADQAKDKAKNKMSE